MFCHAMIYWLPDDALTDAVESLSTLCDFHSHTRSQLGAGMVSLVRKRIDTLAKESYTDEGLARLKDGRDQLVHCVEYAEQAISRMEERIELADLFTSDAEPSLRASGVVSRYVPDDGPLDCDPD